MAKIFYKTTEKIPDYALPYLVNGDASGLCNEDVTVIDNYMKWFYETAKTVHGNVVISPTEQESYFAWNPAFGLGSTVLDTDILILV
jgi:hypothetical protein